MNILVGKTFGLGNAVMCVPMLKTLKSMGHRVDVMVGSLPDDCGAFAVMECLRDSDVIDNLFINRAGEIIYDVAIMAIPFDGRWRNTEHFKAIKVMDGRTRPDPTTEGLVSWEKHEIEYQMDNARDLGYEGPTPDCSFHAVDKKTRDIYFGVGYKKDDAGFWKKKHWGNEKFSQLATRILKEKRGFRIRSTGDIMDWHLSLQPIMRGIHRDVQARFVPEITDISQAFYEISTCRLYVGNDTGMMHVAASMGIPCVAVFPFGRKSSTKNGPWGTHGHHCYDGEETTVSQMFRAVNDVLGWK